MPRYGERKYRVGIDVGDRSVGLAFIEFDEQDMPSELLRMFTVRHDGGIDPTTNKTPKSRKETAGVARRVRKMRKRRTRRLQELDALLMASSFPIVDVSVGETYECWQARAAAVEGFIADEQTRLETVSRAIRHMARHRGWRNPWLTWQGFKELEVPTANHQKNIESANSKLHLDLEDTATLGQIAASASASNWMLRPRNGQKRKAASDPVLVAQVQQADQLAELYKILEVQRIDSTITEKIARAVFDQVRPYVPKGNIGLDELPGMGNHYRASKASLAFQEFRVRAAVANLRIKNTARGQERFRLDPQDAQAVAEYLLTWREDQPPQWGDVANALNIDENLLVIPVFEDAFLKLAPYDRTSSDLEQRLSSSANKKKVAGVREWWDSADTQMRELFIEFITSPNESVYEEADESGFSDVFNGWSDEAKEVLLGMQFESGRSAYSVESLRRLNLRLRTGEVDLHEARRLEFGVDDTWRPSLPSIDERTGQPAVDRVLTIVRRAIMGAVDKWGVPEAVVVEHARSGFMGASARNDYLNEVSRRTATRAKLREIVKQQGVERPSDGDIHKWECINRQRCTCAYCGNEITFTTAEMDHIVPRAGGGSNVRENLVAVCRRCNSEKRNIPFAIFADSDAHPYTSLNETLTRVRNWDWSRDRSEQRLKNRMLQRLKRRESDPEIDERSLASTAYAAVEVRQRIAEYLGRVTGKDELNRVQVYTGGATREARRAGKIDARIRIRGKDEKDRFDVRHHAIDAAVMATLNHSVAFTLRERAEMKRSATMNRYLDPNEEWKDYSGRTPSAQERFTVWRQQAHRLADLIVDAIEADSIPVAQQLRLSASRGSVHKDTVSALVRKQLGDPWTAQEILQIVDPDIYALLRDFATPNRGVLELDPSRRVQLPSGVWIEGSDLVEVFPKAAASMKISSGSVEIGEQIHHARVYAWRGTKGEFQYGILRVFTAELPWLQRQAKSKDLFTMNIDDRSMSYRDLQPTVRKKIESSESQCIGWLTQNDELVLDVEVLQQGSDKLAHFLKTYPESRWKLDGFPMSRQFRIRPLYLSREGSDHLDPICAEILEKGAIVSASGVLNNTHQVLRRDSLSYVRWRSQGGLPVSWSISVAATNTLGADVK